jgi:hypothetical protein
MRRSFSGSRWETITLSARAFGHLSQGLYRTPGGSIKELVSNAFDADARIVRIHTDFPRFMSFSCEDDGTGMPRSEFTRLVNGGIGDSFKRTANYTSSTRGRPTVGRLGLGILALAQVCTEFEIVSHHAESKSAFRATIKFLPYTREEMDRRASEAQKTDKPVEGGQYQIEEIAFDASAPSLRIFTSQLRETYQKTMRDLEHYGNRRESKDHRVNYDPYKTFEGFLKTIYGKPATRSMTLRSSYDQLLFGLALSPPLTIIASENVSAKLATIRERQRVLDRYDFQVEVDNLILRNPVFLPSDSVGTRASSCIAGKPIPLVFNMTDGSTGEECQASRIGISVENSDLTFNIYDFAYAARVGGRDLAFSGYLFQQTQRLFPQDIQGVLIRINNVAIGKYDNSMFSYPYAEGPRFSMVTSEIFIKEGFEDALNIDRDGFNELHAHYQRVRAYFHSFLHGSVFPKTWDEESKRNSERRNRKSAQRQSQYASAFKDITGTGLGQVKLVTRNSADAQTRDIDESPVDFGPRSVRLQEAHPVLEALRRKRIRPVVERIVIAFERANAESSSAKRRAVFYKLLVEIFHDA